VSEIIEKSICLARFFWLPNEVDPCRHKSVLRGETYVLSDQSDECILAVVR